VPLLRLSQISLEPLVEPPLVSPLSSQWGEWSSMGDEQHTSRAPSQRGAIREPMGPAFFRGPCPTKCAYQPRKIWWLREEKKSSDIFVLHMRNLPSVFTRPRSKVVPSYFGGRSCRWPMRRLTEAWKNRNLGLDHHHSVGHDHRSQLPLEDISAVGFQKCRLTNSNWCV